MHLENWIYRVLCRKAQKCGLGGFPHEQLLIDACTAYYVQAASKKEALAEPYRWASGIGLLQYSKGLWTYLCRGHNFRIVSRYVRLKQKSLIVRLGIPRLWRWEDVKSNPVV